MLSGHRHATPAPFIKSALPTEHAMSIQLAAITHTGNSSHAQHILKTFIQHLQSQGLRAAGLVSTDCTLPDGRTESCIQSIESGLIYPIFQNLGQGAESCRLDPAKLAAASGELTALINNPPDLAVVNRFGVTEANGRGFRQELMNLVLADIPVVTLLNRKKYAEAWHAFTGGCATELEADLNQLQNWFNACLKNNA